MNKIDVFDAMIFRCMKRIMKNSFFSNFDIAKAVVFRIFFIQQYVIE
ncbi:MAG: hypothetical protein TRG1_2179 [Flavobacteriaceae bacterium FS1-H7996/R]|nr:MAG: hypothetical protein TRG1_2179 [Flavobacteriaceae bacterium FS1-H7996/R]